jgi:MoxR-like ATPase
MRFSIYYTREKANLFVSGPLGVGKTLTAKALSKHLKRLLYIVHPIY